MLHYSAPGKVRRCMIPGEPEAKQDQTGALVSNDLCKFGHEISGIQGLRPEHLDRAEIIPRVTQMSAAREEHRQPRMLVTSAAAARSEGRKASWKILAWILSSNSHADQPGERNLEVRSRRYNWAEPCLQRAEECA